MFTVNYVKLFTVTLETQLGFLSEVTSTGKSAKVNVTILQINK